MSVDQPIAYPPPSLFAGVEPLEVFVELLAEIDMHTAPTEFYDRICEAICRLTTMRRAADVYGRCDPPPGARNRLPRDPVRAALGAAGRRWSTLRSRSGR